MKANNSKCILKPSFVDPFRQNSGFPMLGSCNSSSLSAFCVEGPVCTCLCFSLVWQLLHARAVSLTCEFQPLQYQMGNRVRVIFGGTALSLWVSAAKSERRKHPHENRQMWFLYGGKLQQLVETFLQGRISLGAHWKLKENTSVSAETFITVIPPYHRKHVRKSKKQSWAVKMYNNWEN